jgi:hypothetical protein
VLSACAGASPFDLICQPPKQVMHVRCLYVLPPCSAAKVGLMILLSICRASSSSQWCQSLIQSTADRAQSVHCVLFANKPASGMTKICGHLTVMPCFCVSCMLPFIPVLLVRLATQWVSVFAANGLAHACDELSWCLHDDK